MTECEVPAKIEQLVNILNIIEARGDGHTTCGKACIAGAVAHNLTKDGDYQEVRRKLAASPDLEEQLLDAGCPYHTADLLDALDIGEVYDQLPVNVARTLETHQLRLLSRIPQEVRREMAEALVGTSERIVGDASDLVALVEGEANLWSRLVPLPPDTDTWVRQETTPSDQITTIRNMSGGIFDIACDEDQGERLVDAMNEMMRRVGVARRFAYEKWDSSSSNTDHQEESR